AIAEAHAADHGHVDRERLLAVHDERPARIVRLRELAAGLEPRIQLLARARVFRAGVDLLRGFDLRRRETLARAAARALQGARIETAGARVAQNSVLHAVARVALRDRRVAQQHEIGRGEHGAGRLQRGVRGPELTHVQVREAIHGRARYDAVVIIGIALRFH